MSFGELSTKGFAEALASSNATPGGGSASALSGALAAALVAMVGRLTPEGLDEVVAEAVGLRDELLALVDEDARAFDQVMAAFRLPKETDDEKAARSEAVQEGYKAAAAPPLRVCARAVRLLELALQVAEQGNANAVSDAGVAALLASAALEGAALNVRINLGSIKDGAFRRHQDETVGTAQQRGSTLREQTLKAVQARIG